MSKWADKSFALRSISRRRPSGWDLVPIEEQLDRLQAEWDTLLAEVTAQNAALRVTNKELTIQRDEARRALDSAIGPQAAICRSCEKRNKARRARRRRAQVDVAAPVPYKPGADWRQRA